MQRKLGETHHNLTTAGLLRKDTLQIPPWCDPDEPSACKCGETVIPHESCNKSRASCFCFMNLPDILAISRGPLYWYITSADSSLGFYNLLSDFWISGLLVDMDVCMAKERHACQGGVRHSSHYRSDNDLQSPKSAQTKQRPVIK